LAFLAPERSLTMRFIQEPAAMAGWSSAMRRAGRSIGFVPTMGALHEGHLALVARAKAECGAVCASIFVNPLQFNNPEDLRHYPRQMEQDRRLLEEAGCDALFTPEEAGIYHDHVPKVYTLGVLDEVLEGPSRPGHFQGVVNVVERLFHYVRPDAAYFGEKDRQQLAVIRHVSQALRWPERIVPCETLRADDGLALSSRNQRLSPEDRAIAPVVFRSLRAVREKAFLVPVDEALSTGQRLLSTEPAVRLDYLAIADPVSLRPLENWEGLDEAVALIAVWLGPVRLIDNVTLRRPAR
jgi:pantoate--beta-alanine ligase